MQGEEAKATQFKWPPLESDPSILTNYLQKIGMSKEWQFAEVFGLDPDLLAMVPQPCVALIVAIEKGKNKDETVYESTAMPYYQKQTNTLDNACGLIACIHAVLNNRTSIGLDEGSALEELEKATAAMNPLEKAKFLETYTKVQQAHQSFASEGQSKLCETQSDVKHHFIAIVRNAKGQLVELDGMRDIGPRVLGECTEDNFLEKAGAEIMKRVTNGYITESLAVSALVRAND